MKARTTIKEAESFLTMAREAKGSESPEGTMISHVEQMCEEARWRIQKILHP